MPLEKFCQKLKESVFIKCLTWKIPDSFFFSRYLQKTKARAFSVKDFKKKKKNTQ